MSRRRGANEGTVFKRQDGRWCGVLSTGRDALNRRRRLYVYGASAAEVHAALTEAKARLLHGEQFHNGNGVTLASYAEKWIESAKHNLKPATVRSYEQILRVHICPAFGWVKLREVDHARIKALLSEKRKVGLSKNTVRLIRATLSAILGEAVEDGLIAANPALALSRRRGAKRPDRLTATERTGAMRPFSEAELSRFLEAAERDEYNEFFLLLARTGLRPGEAYALEWDDLDFSRREILVERALSIGTVSTPKTGEARRVDMSPQLREALLRLRTKREKEALAKGWPDVPRTVFINDNGKFLDESRVRKRFSRTMKKAGLSGHRLYDLRHTYATLLLAKGAPITYVAAQLGHAKPSTTLHWYARWLPDGGKPIVDLLDTPSPTAVTKPQGASGPWLSNVAVSQDRATAVLS